MKWTAETVSIGESPLSQTNPKKSKRQHIKPLQITPCIILCDILIQTKPFSVHAFGMMLLATIRHNQNVNLEGRTY